MARREERPRHECETSIFGACHAKIGAYLLNLWGLPAPVVDAIAFHHNPRPAPRGFSLGGLTHVADILAHEIGRPCGLSAIGVPVDLDESLACLRAAGSDAQGEIGDEDPLRAIEDALRTFGADSIVVATPPDGAGGSTAPDVAAAAQARFALPVARVVVGAVAQTAAAPE